MYYHSGMLSCYKTLALSDLRFTNKQLSLTLYIYVTGPAKIDHVSAKNRRFLACLLYHTLITICTTATKSSSLLQNLMGFLLQLLEMG